MQPQANIFPLVNLPEVSHLQTRDSKYIDSFLHQIMHQICNSVFDDIMQSK